MIKTILITGSGGFVGGNLKEYLNNKYQLYTPRSYELNMCDEISVADYFQQNDIDFIIHCGSVGGYRNLSDKDTTIEDNLAMVDNILKHKKPQARVILFGSGAMYDRKRDLHKVKEDGIGQFIPAELYGKSKMLISQKIENREDVLCLNIFGCYGKNEKDTRFPTYAINSVLFNKDIEINQNVIFDYLHIQDLEKIIEYFIKNKPNKNVINVTPTESISLLEIANIANSFADNKVNIIVKNQTMNFEYTGDNARLLEEMPNIKFTSYKDGMKLLYNQLKEKHQL